MECLYSILLKSVAVSSVCACAEPQHCMHLNPKGLGACSAGSALSFLHYLNVLDSISCLALRSDFKMNENMKQLTYDNHSFLQSLTEDVNRQTDREKLLQKRYSELQAELEELHKGRQRETHAALE